MRLLGWVAISLVLGYAAVAGLDRASRRHFWYDEIYTVALARLPSGEDIWRALGQGTDANPPAYYILESWLQHVVNDPHVSFRLASVAGYLLTSLALFMFVRRRAGPVAGLAVAVLACLTPVFTRYSVEARPYAVLLACLSWAMVMWQQLDRPWRAVALGLLLAGAVSVHFYAILALGPFGLAELARSIRARQIRSRVWLAILAGALPFAVFWPILRGIRERYGAHFWSPARLDHLVGVHDTNLGLPDQLGAALAMALSLALCLRIVRAFRRSASNQANTEEPVLLLALINLPAIAYAVSLVMGGGLTPRYVMPSVLGVFAAVGIVAAGRSRSTATWCLGTLLLLGGLREVDYWRRLPAPAVEALHPESVVLDQMLGTGGRGDLPVVISDGISYLQLAFYSENARRRLAYLSDPDAGVRHARSDSVDASLDRLAQVTSLNVVSRLRFLERHDTFFMFTGPNRFDWLPDQLVQDGYRLRPVTVREFSAGHRVLYLVERPQE